VAASGDLDIAEVTRVLQVTVPAGGRQPTVAAPDFRMQ
jgi:hypothetical protein